MLAGLRWSGGGLATVGRRYVLEDPNAEGSSEEKRFDAFARGARALIRSYLFENSMAKMDEMEMINHPMGIAAIKADGLSKTIALGEPDGADRQRMGVHGLEFPHDFHPPGVDYVPVAAPAAPSHASMKADPYAQQGYAQQGYSQHGYSQQGYSPHDEPAHQYQASASYAGSYAGNSAGGAWPLEVDEHMMAGSVHKHFDPQVPKL